MVVDNLAVHNGNINWNVLFTRQLQDWEMEMVLSFFERLYSTSIRQGEGDKLVCHIMKCFVGKKAHHSRGRIYGVLRLRQGWRSLYGLQL